MMTMWIATWGTLVYHFSQNLQKILEIKMLWHAVPLLNRTHFLCHHSPLVHCDHRLPLLCWRKFGFISNPQSARVKFLNENVLPFLWMPMEVVKKCTRFCEKIPFWRQTTVWPSLPQHNEGPVSKIPLAFTRLCYIEVIFTCYSNREKIVLRYTGLTLLKRGFL